MAYVVCVEEIDGRWVAHTPDLPGCFASDADREIAIKALPGAVESYLQWCRSHGLLVSGLSAPMIVNEVVRSWAYEPDQEVNAFFAADRPPLEKAEVPEYQYLLAATRADLLATVEGLRNEQLLREFSGERWPMLGVLRHVASAEWWYLDRLGLAFAREQLAEDPFERLDQVREGMLEHLPQLPSYQNVVTLGGETWSARKVLRRALWHERDHTQHLNRLRRMLG
jgi:predicted RNase H-like HicB family nuclease/uncharacterized damage-inducible protein DinB